VLSLLEEENATGFLNDVLNLKNCRMQKVRDISYVIEWV